MERDEGMPDGGGDVVVLTSSNSWSDQRMADHQLAKALAERVRILFVDPPAFGMPVLSVKTVGSAEVNVLRPLRLPLVGSAWTRRLSRHVIAWQIRRVLRQMAADRVTLLTGNVLFPVTTLLDADDSVYWAQDDWQGLASVLGLDADGLDANERSVLSASRAVIAANPLVAERLERLHDRVRLIPFGASTGMFRQAAEIEVEGDEHPVLLMGTLNSRIDYAILEAVVRAGVPLLIAGPIDTGEAGARLDALLATGRVEYLGSVDFDRLPAVLAQCSVGVVPYNRSRFNLGSFPLKTLEYLAAGLPVVATDLPAIRWVASGDVHIADGPQAFAAVVKELWERGRPDSEARTRRARFAAGHDWNVRAAEFLEVIDMGRPQHAEAVR